MGSWEHVQSVLAPIFPVSDMVSGTFFVSSIVFAIRSSNCRQRDRGLTVSSLLWGFCLWRTKDILTDWASAWERESFVLRSVLGSAVKASGVEDDRHVARSSSQSYYVIIYTIWYEIKRGFQRMWKIWLAGCNSRSSSSDPRVLFHRALSYRVNIFHHTAKVVHTEPLDFEPSAVWDGWMTG